MRLWRRVFNWNGKVPFVTKGLNERKIQSGLNMVDFKGKMNFLQAFL